MISILSTSNALDGVHATLVLTGTANGAISFKICRQPIYANAVVATAVETSSSPLTYNVATPFPALWYIWAVDTDGQSGPGAAWVCITNDPDLRSCGEKIAALLTEHTAGINAALNQLLPGGTVKQIVFGRRLNVEDFPSIVVSKPRMTDNYIGLGFIRETTFAFEIAFAFFHQDEGSQLPIATDMAQRVMSILNLPCYSSLVLDTGTPLTACLATEGESDETEIDEKTWVAAATVVWSAQGLIQDTGANT